MSGPRNPYPAGGTPNMREQIDPRVLLVTLSRQFFGLGDALLGLLGVDVESCICGTCHGWRIVFRNAAHVAHGKFEVFRPGLAKSTEEAGGDAKETGS